MNKNEYFNMLEIIKNVGKDTSLLLHSCCAPCSSACLEVLHSHFSVTVFYYNPNIDDGKEYEKRKSEQIRFIKETGWADIIDCSHEKEKFEKIARGLENEPERGKRCYLCYELRLEEAAKTAAERGFDYFTTTLSLSPYKNSAWINEIGRRLEQKYGVKFLPSDFKKQGGYLRSIKLSEKYGLYRQDFAAANIQRKKL